MSVIWTRRLTAGALGAGLLCSTLGWTKEKASGFAKGSVNVSKIQGQDCDVLEDMAAGKRALAELGQDLAQTRLYKVKGEVDPKAFAVQKNVRSVEYLKCKGGITFLHLYAAPKRTMLEGGNLRFVKKDPHCQRYRLDQSQPDSPKVDTTFFADENKTIKIDVDKFVYGLTCVEPNESLASNELWYLFGEDANKKQQLKAWLKPYRSVQGIIPKINALRSEHELSRLKVNSELSKLTRHFSPTIFHIRSEKAKVLQLNTLKNLELLAELRLQSQGDDQADLELLLSSPAHKAAVFDTRAKAVGTGKKGAYVYLLLAGKRD